MGESGKRRLHADQGQQDLDPLSRGARGRGQAPGGDRRPLPLQHQSDRGLHHARPGQRRPFARPPARGADLVLPAQHGFHLQEPVPVREHAVVEAGHGGARRGGAEEGLSRPVMARRGAQRTRERRAAAWCSTANGTSSSWSRRPRPRTGDGRRDPGRVGQEGRQGPARLHPRLRPVGEPRHRVRGPAPAQRREGGRQDPGRSQHPHLAVAMPAPTSPSSATPASACT